MTSEQQDQARDHLFCRATRKDGQPCRAWPDESGFCPAHRNGHQERCALGGSRSARKFRLEKRLSPRLLPIVELLERSVKETHDGLLSPSAASAMASLVASLIKVLEFGEYAKTVEDLEREMQSRGLLP